MAQITGTFVAPGASTSMSAASITIQLDFTGNPAQVDIQSQMPGGSWITVETVKADYHKIFDQGGVVPIRLNCTAVTGSIEYAMTSV